MFEDNHDIEVNGLWDTNTKRGLQVFLHQQAGGEVGGDGWKHFFVGKMPWQNLKAISENPKRPLREFNVNLICSPLDG